MIGYTNSPVVSPDIIEKAQARLAENYRDVLSATITVEDVWVKKKTDGFDISHPWNRKKITWILSDDQLERELRNANAKLEACQQEKARLEQIKQVLLAEGRIPEGSLKHRFAF